MQNKKIDWHPISREKVYSTRIFDIENIKSISPKGDEKTFIGLSSPEWAIVVPIVVKEGKRFFVMVRQWRHAASILLDEFPGGVINEGEEPVEAAKRELMEETGYITKNITHLGSLFPNPAIMQNRCHIFFAECEENAQVQNCDSDEFIDVILVEYDEILKNMGRHPFQHALMCSALFLFLQKMNVFTSE